MSLLARCALLLLIAGLGEGRVAASEAHETRLRERYHAVIAAGEALTVSGELRQDQIELLTALADAWRRRDEERFRSLLEQAEDRFGSNVPIGAALRIVIDPELELIDGPADRRRVEIRFLEAHRDVWFLAASQDELQLHQRLLADSVPFVIVATGNALPSNPANYVPPPGWAERAMLVERWRRVADLAARRLDAPPLFAPPLIISAGPPPESDAYRAWSIADRLARPDGPFMARGVSPKMISALNVMAGDHWLVEPSTAERDPAAPVRILARLRATRLDILASADLPWFEIFKRLMVGEATIFSFPDRRVTAIRFNRNEWLILNEEARPVRFELLPLPGPISARVAYLREEGSRIDEQGFVNASSLQIDLPSNEMTLILVN
jgi:hypothetical protein